MSTAFACDICDGLEAGAPAQRITVTPAMGQPEPLELCSSCLVAFNDWRVSRAPLDDMPAQEQYA